MTKIRTILECLAEDSAMPSIQQVKIKKNGQIRTDHTKYLGHHDAILENRFIISLEKEE